MGHTHEYRLLKLGSGYAGDKYPDEFYCVFCLEKKYV